MTRRLIALNAGSSSLKAEIFTLRGDGWASDARAAVDGIGGARAALRWASRELEPLDRLESHRVAATLLLDRAGAEGLLDDSASIVTVHRVVHGGRRFTRPVRVTPAVLDELVALTPLAPLHNPPALDVLAAARERLPAAPAVAVFDTAFFERLPEHARVYAIPAAWRRDGEVRRYGFHGIAHECLDRSYHRLQARAGRARRVVTLQLGHGCSAAALLDGLPVDTSMGYTPLEGLIMGTRTGDLDPGVLVDLARRGVSADELDFELNRRSGLLALSGRSADMREILAREAEGDADAALAVAAFCHRVRKYVGAYAAVLGGLDALVFGGGIGENAPEIRRRVCSGFGWLGLEIDTQANASWKGEAAAVSARTSRVDVAVVAVREERAIARHACECLGHDIRGLEP